MWHGLHFEFGAAADTRRAHPPCGLGRRCALLRRGGRCRALRRGRCLACTARTRRLTGLGTGTMTGRTVLANPTAGTLPSDAFAISHLHQRTMLSRGKHCGWTMLNTQCTPGARQRALHALSERARPAAPQPRARLAVRRSPFAGLPAVGLALARSFFVFALRSASACASVTHGYFRACRAPPQQSALCLLASALFVLGT